MAVSSSLESEPSSHLLIAALAFFFSLIVGTSIWQHTQTRVWECDKKKKYTDNGTGPVYLHLPFSRENVVVIFVVVTCVFGFYVNNFTCVKVSFVDL
jgi:hypothetical protein